MKKVKLLKSLAVLTLSIMLSVVLINHKAFATDYDKLNIWGGSWNKYRIPNGGDSDALWQNPAFKKDGIRLIENSLIGDNGKKYHIVTGTQLPVYASNVGFRTHTIEGHFVTDMDKLQENYYTSRGCINDVSYCAEPDHGLYKGTPGNNSFIRYQLDSPTKNFSPLDVAGGNIGTEVYSKIEGNRYYLKVVTYPKKRGDLMQEVVSTVGDEGEILTYVRVTNKSAKTIPHIRVGAQITMNSLPSYKYTSTGFDGVAITPNDYINTTNLPKYFKAISGANPFVNKWNINDINVITDGAYSPKCKDLGTQLQSGKGMAIFFVADQTSILPYGKIEFSYLTSFRSEEKPDNVVHKTYVDDETGKVFTKEDQKGSTCLIYNKDVREIKGYEFINTTGDSASGTFDGRAKNVTYHYKRKTLTAIGKHIDEQGNIISSDTTAKNLYNEKVSLSAKDIYGYRYLRWSKGGSYGTSKTAEITLADSTHSTAKGDENTVYFNYQKKKEFNLRVNHYSIDDRTIFHWENIPVFADDEYDLNDYIKKITGNKFVKADHPMKFKMGYANLEVTLEYEKVKTTITVEYVDDLNRKIVNDIVYTGKYDAWQKIEEKSFNGYFLNPAYPKIPIQQQFGAEDRKVTFNYDRNKVKFNVIHKDDQGKILQQEQVEYKYLDDYDESKVYDDDSYILIESPKNAKGIVALNQADIIFVYRKKVETKVTAKYVDEDGKVLGSEVKKGMEGKSYNFTVRDITGYTFVNSSESLSGVYTDKDKEIILYYKKNTITLTLKYIEEATGIKIADATTLQGKYNDEYTLPDPKTIDDYVYVRLSNSKTGKFTTNMDITYYYRKLKESSITVKYYNDANKKLGDDTIINGKEGQSYQTEQKEFEGHTFEETKGDSPSGIFGVTGKTVTYLYNRNEYTVTIKYIDKTTNSIIAQEVKKGKYDTKYTSEAKVFDDYILDKVPDNAEGIYKPDNAEVIYEYHRKKDYKLNVKHVDDRGELLFSEVVEGREGDSYTTNKIEKTGYYFVKVEGNPNGIFSDDSTNIIYRYDRIKSKVILKHLGYNNLTLDDNPESIAKDVIIEGKYLDEYKIKPQSIVNYDFIEADSKLDNTYTLNETIIYLKYYHKDAEVKVEYVDDRNALLGDEIINGKQGDKFETKLKNFSGYYFKKIEDDKSPNGNFTEQRQRIVYLYDREIQKVTIRHLGYNNSDMSDKPTSIAEDIEIQGKYLDEYKINPQVIANYDFIEADSKLHNQYSLDDTVITLKYYHKDAEVKVEYVDDRNVLIEDEIVKGKQGDKFETKQKEFPHYQFIKIEDDKSPNGFFTEKKQHVVYQYDRNKSKVIIKHLGYDESKKSDNEQIIAEDTIIEGKYQDEYDIKPEFIKNYNYVQADQKLHNLYYYDELTINLKYLHKYSDVKVKYVDDRNQILKQSVIHGKEGHEYRTEQLDFPGYVFKEVDGVPNGILEETNSDVIYHYDRINTNVTFRHLGYDSNDEGSSSTIAEDVVIENKYLEPYDYTPPTIENYEFIRADNDLKGNHGLNSTVVNLIYHRKDAAINVKHVDDRNQLLFSEVIEGKEGHKYATSSLNRPGYTFVSIDGESSGVFKGENEDIIYHYDRVKTKVTFKHIADNSITDKNPKVIAENTIIEGKYLDEYNYNPEVIAGYEFVKAIPSTKGTFELDDKVITLVYKYNELNINNTLPLTGSNDIIFFEYMILVILSSGLGFIVLYNKNAYKK